MVRPVRRDALGRRGVGQLDRLGVGIVARGGGRTKSASSTASGASAAPARATASTSPGAIAGARAGRERDVAERDLAADRRGLQRHGVRGVDDLRLEVQVLEDPVEQRERALDLDLHVEQLAEREEQAALERGERDDVAGGRRGRVARRGERARQPVHERGHDREDRADDREEPAADHRLADLELAPARG